MTYCVKGRTNAGDTNIVEVSRSLKKMANSTLCPERHMVQFPPLFPYHPFIDSRKVFSGYVVRHKQCRSGTSDGFQGSSRLCNTMSSSSWNWRSIESQAAMVTLIPCCRYDGGVRFGYRYLTTSNVRRLYYAYLGRTSWIVNA